MNHSTVITIWMTAAAVTYLWCLGASIWARRMGVVAFAMCLSLLDALFGVMPPMFALGHHIPPDDQWRQLWEPLVFVALPVVVAACIPMGIALQRSKLGTE
jgi:hypothetical protein